MTPASIIPVFGSQRPYADLNFAGGSFGLDGRSVSDLTALPGFTFTRASLAMGYDATGKLVYGPNNLLLMSQRFDQAEWTKSGSTITADAATAPDGTLTADKLVEDVANSQHRTFNNLGVTVSTAETVVYSIYAKAAERNFLFLADNNGSGAFFNLTTGVVSDLGSGVTAVNATSVGNGWWRCCIARVPTTSSGRLAAGASTASGTNSYTGDPTKGIFIWGAQIEAVTYQTTPSTYYPTTTAAYYGPRLVCDPVTLASQGILVEEARTNLLLQSQTLDNASWLKSNITVTANAATAPDGTVTADKAIAATGSVNPLLYQSNTLTAAAYTVSVYAKAAELTWLAIRFDPATTKYSWFDLSNGVVGTVDATHTASIQSVGNGWYRCIVTATGTAASWFSVITPTTANNVSTYTGNSVNGIYVWQAQLELGTGASSPIPTTTAAVTRAADAATLTGISVPNPHSMAAEWTPGFDNGSNFRRVGVLTNSGGTPEDSIYQRHTTSEVRANVTGTADVTLGTGNTATANKAAARFETNNTTGSLNGAATVSPDTSLTLPTGVDRLFIGIRSGTLDAQNGTISRIRIYNRALPDAQLQSLTT